MPLLSGYLPDDWRDPGATHSKNVTDFSYSYATFPAITLKFVHNLGNTADRQINTQTRQS